MFSLRPIRPVIICLGMFFVASGPLQAVEPLVWKWTKGDTARYQLTQTTKMTVDAGPAGKVNNSSRQETVIRWTVKEKNDADGAEISQATERVVVKHEGSMGQGFQYDSADEEPPAGMAALVAPMFEAIVANDLLLTMLPTGEVTEVELSDELKKAFERLPGGALSGEKIADMTKQGSLRFPEKPLKVGDEWTNTVEVNAPQIGPMKVLTTYVYDGTREVDGQQLDVFTPTVAIETTGESEGGDEAKVTTKDSGGEVLFNRETGRVDRSKVEQTMEIRMTVGDREMVNEVKQTISMRLLKPDEQIALPEQGE